MEGKQMKLKVDKRALSVVLLLFPMIKPVEDALAVIIGNSLAHVLIRVLSVWDYSSIFICLLLFINGVLKRKFPIQTYTKIIVCFSILCIVSTLREFSYNILYICRIIGNLWLIILLANIYSGERIKYFLQGCYLYLTLISIINSLSIYLFYPNGMNAVNYYLYGLDNMGFIIAFHGFLLGMICQIIYYDRIKNRFKLLYLLIFGAYVYSGSGTAIIITIASVIFILFYDTWLMKGITYKRALMICILVFVCITLIPTDGVFTEVSILLGKGSSFNGRTVIWAAMFDILPRHLWTGFGISPDVTQYYIGLYPSGGWLNSIGHMHNVVFEFLFRGGLIGFVFFCIMWLMSIEKMEKYNQYLVYRVLCTQLILSLLTCMFEYRIDTYTFWLVPICIYNIENLCEINTKKKFKGIKEEIN